MEKNLYIGNLSYEVNSEELNELFSQAGEVSSVKIVTDRYTGQSRGFGFVEMATEEAAAQAINKFNGYSLKGRDITVSEARPKKTRSYQDRSGSRRSRW
jgi:cold-inducible RNA-binding protein